MKTIPFVKMHGNGNDFIVVDEFNEAAVKRKALFAAGACDRRFGIGADGVLFVSRANDADLKMRLFQPDGSEAEMCGNGIRCLVAYAVDAGHVKRGNVVVRTKGGKRKVIARKNSVIVDMGKPLFARHAIPAQGTGEEFVETMYGVVVSAVNTGVPHAIVFDDKFEDKFEELAPKIRNDPIFPHGVNVSFVQVDGNMLFIRTYERGIERETLSCGTGAVAAAAVANQMGLIGTRTTVNTQGGSLLITLRDGHAFMEGPTETVYKGTYFFRGIRRPQYHYR